MIEFRKTVDTKIQAPGLFLTRHSKMLCRTGKGVIQFLVLFVVISNIQAQKYDITIDSLRFRFQNEKPYDVFDYYKTRISLLSKDNYKTLYYDQEIKGYLLKWLDQDQILDYEKDKFKKYLYSFNEKDKTSFLKRYISRAFKLNPDSIKSDAALWKLYADSAISARAEEQKIQLLQEKQESKRDILPDWEVMYFHARIAYPESYKIIKDWWYQYNKPVAKNHVYFDDLFTFLLLMNDPEAQSEFDKIVHKYVKTKGEVYADNYSLAFLTYFETFKNAYGLKKMIELLPVQTKIPGLASAQETSFYSFDYRMFNLIKWMLVNQGIDTSGLFNDIDTMRKNKKEIVRLANQLIKKLEEDEKYWMENMPFDYIPNTK